MAATSPSGATTNSAAASLPSNWLRVVGDVRYVIQPSTSGPTSEAAAIVVARAATAQGSNRLIRSGTAPRMVSGVPVVMAVSDTAGGRRPYGGSLRHGFHGQ